MEVGGNRPIGEVKKLPFSNRKRGTIARRTRRGREDTEDIGKFV
jgi:hypothetical protein